jgi:putative transposase
LKASQFSDAQKAFILKQGADGIPVADICRKAGISQATYFNWKKKYDGLLPTEMRRLKLLEDENTKLRKLVADLSLDREMLQDVIRRKLSGLLASASWSTSFVVTGMYRSAGPAGFSRSRVHLPLQIPSARSGRDRCQDQGDLHGPRAVRLPPRARRALQRGQEGERQESP